jgi:hypothetical protein
MSTTQAEGRVIMSATLRLTRKITFAVELRRGRFEISVDGKDVGSIDNNETVEVRLQPGLHTVQLRHGRYSSRELSFDVAEDDAIDFRCHGARVWPTYLASFVVPSLAISLRHE